MKAYGKTVWMIPDTYLNSISGPANVSHGAICVLNTGDADAHMTFTLYFEDREPRCDYHAVCGARRTNHVRLDKLLSDSGEEIRRDVPYAILVTSDVPVICQYSRLDTSAEAMALMTTIAYAE